MTPWTLVMAYYENPRMLEHQLTHLANLPADIGGNLNLVIVDDGSPTAPAKPVVEQLGDVDLASLQVWRMGVDVRWNQDACRNVGVREARTQWVLLTDMDHVVPLATWSQLIHRKLNKHCVYRFARVSAPDMQPYKLHPNSWALTQKMYWRVGGYDEELAGNYGTDGDFLVRARGVAAELIELPEHLVRYPREVIADASTTQFERKRPEEKEAIKMRIRARLAGWRPRLFSFPCERVL